VGEIWRKLETLGKSKRDPHQTAVRLKLGADGVVKSSEHDAATAAVEGTAAKVVHPDSEPSRPVVLKKGVDMTDEFAVPLPAARGDSPTLLVGLAAERARARRAELIDRGKVVGLVVGALCLLVGTLLFMREGDDVDEPQTATPPIEEPRAADTHDHAASAIVAETAEPASSTPAAPQSSPRRVSPPPPSTTRVPKPTTAPKPQASSAPTPQPSSDFVFPPDRDAP
jgi:hypothetical protein